MMKPSTRYPIRPARATPALVPLLYLSLNAPVFSQNMTETETDILPRLIDSICIDDLHETNGCETAVLLVNRSDPSIADLVILTDRRSAQGSRPLAVVRGVATNGSMFGMSPSLGQGQNGSLLLHSEQIGMGRSPWEQTLTIVVRNDTFVVAGFTYSTYDRLDLTSFSCDLNLRTGAYISSTHETEQSGKAAPIDMELSDWDALESFPEPCRVLHRESLK